jgi:hypothetical protein
MANEVAGDRPAITDELVEEIVEESETCERSVMRRLLGLQVRGRAGERVDREIAARLHGGERAG